MNTQQETPDKAPEGFSDEWIPRFQAARAQLDSLRADSGWADIYILDRSTHGVWSCGDVRRPGWTASTIKLAIAADLLERQHGQLTAADRSDLHAILHSSDNDATDRLWERYGNEAMLARFRDRFGMVSLAFQPGHSETTYWRFVKCSTLDLVALGRHILEQLEPAHRAYLLDAMRNVADNQRWGVWSAGSDQKPAVKNGWAEKPDDWGKHWLTRSIGFVGPGERYIVGVNYQHVSPGSLDYGVQAVSDAVAVLFGQPVPAHVSIPTD